MDWGDLFKELGLAAAVGGAASALLITVLAPAFEARRRRWERLEKRRLDLADVCAAVVNTVIAVDRNSDVFDGPENEYFRLGQVSGLFPAARSGFDLGLPRTERDAHRLLERAHVAIHLGQPEDTSEPELREAMRDVTYLLRRPPWRWPMRIWVRRRLTKRLVQLEISRKAVPKA